MSWLHPTSFEQARLEQAKANLPGAVIELARYVTLVPRVQPLLLRNIRANLVACADTESEAQLWFSNLVSISSTSEFILYPGIARLLAQELRTNQQALTNCWQETLVLTQHWLPLQQLECVLRYHSLQEDQPAVDQCLQDILREITQQQTDKGRVELARWAKRNLPMIADHLNASDESSLLAQYAALALGDSADWTKLAKQVPLPDWLQPHLPAAQSKTQIGLRLYFDPEEQRQVLECIDPGPDDTPIPLATPLPTRLCIQAKGQPPEWEAVDLGTQLPLPADTQSIRITTLAGQGYRLVAEQIDKPIATTPEKRESVTLYLSYVKADTRRAKALAQQLKQQGITVQLLIEHPGEGQPETSGSNIRLLRLWSEAAQRSWASHLESHQGFRVPALLLRNDAAELPMLPGQSDQIIDIRGWDKPGYWEANRQIPEQINSWLAAPPDDIPETTSFENNEGQEEAELAALLQEIDDPAATPERRLEIGDRLAELGDPRPGVGIVNVSLAEEDQSQDLSTSPEELPAALEKLTQLLKQINNTETTPQTRLTIGDELAEIDDPRPGVNLTRDGLPDISWVEIPGGEFIYGEEKEQQSLSLPTFQISRYPITNAQYQAFIDAGGYQEAQWWEELKQPKAEKSEWPQPNRPRTNLDWYEATAFCRWLANRLNKSIRLPDEQEWERAARGNDGRVYPWGNEYINGYANVNESNNSGTHLEQSTTVGLYPHGASLEGVIDLAGNVWEWCRNEHGEITEYLTSANPRVVRGGSWNNYPDRARSALRGRRGPASRNFNLGFRVLCSGPFDQ